MEILDIESRGLTVHEAMKELNEFINEMLKKKVVFAKVIHGYGSNDHGGGKIRIKVIQRLKNLEKEKKIVGFIPGDYKSRLGSGYGDISYRYMKYLKQDAAHRMDNEGVTYICFLNPGS